MKKLLLACAVTLSFYALQAQTIPVNDQPRFIVKNFRPEDNSGTVYITFGVSMSDCIESVEMEVPDNKKVIVFKPTIDNYYVRANDMEEIYARIPVGKYKKIVDRRDGLQATITVTSKTGRVVYKGQAKINLEDAMPENTSGSDVATNHGENPSKATALK